MGNQCIPKWMKLYILYTYTLYVSSVSEDGTLKYNEIRTFLQKQSDGVSTYLSITTSTNNIISLSASHLIYTGNNTFEEFNPM